MPLDLISSGEIGRNLSARDLLGDVLFTDRPVQAVTSLLAVPTLETIPGSVAPTPPAQSTRSSPVEKDDHDRDALALVGSETGGDGIRRYTESGPSRPKPSLATTPSLVSPGSYFPNLSSQPHRAYSPSPSPAASPYDRPRITPLEMPLGTPDDPMFSNYPSTAPSRASSIKGKGRAFAVSLPHALAPAFNLHLGKPLARRRRTKHRPEEEDVGTLGDSSGSSTPAEPGLWNGKGKGRRRANTVSHSPPESPESPSPFAWGSQTGEAGHSHKQRVRPGPPALLNETSAQAGRRRRASVGSAPFGFELQNYPLTGIGVSEWPIDPAVGHMGASVSPSPSRGVSDTDSIAITRPLASPHITPRRSSLISTAHNSPIQPIAYQIPGTTMLGLTNLPEGEVHVILPEDGVIPHDPPPRRSSLSFGPSTVINIKSIDFLANPAAGLEPTSPGVHGTASVLSASLTTTEESGSAEFFSPTSSGAHPLSSAHTSLSRSAKSGKEDDNATAAKDAALTALRLQRSLEWEAKQTRHRRKLEKRRMILLELVETEVAYAEDLKALVEVYLPQLHALPSVPERAAAAVGRNAAELLVIHSDLSLRMVDVLKKEALGYEMLPEEDLVAKVERVSRKLAAALVDQASKFSAYNEFCAGSITAATLVRNISLRTDYTAFERRCQIISSSQPPITLQDLLSNTPLPPHSANKNRLHFRDYLIMPVQRVCRYPLLLAALLGAADTPSPTSELDHPYSDTEEYDVGVDVERALGAMRGVAEEADEARRQSESEIRTATILSRLEPHAALTPAFIKSLGSCRLIGSLDVLHHHPTLAPLVPPVKVKYLAAFLYRGYLVLAKVKKGKVYEAKHFLPLEVFELIDIAEGFLPHSIRLSLRDHNFDLAASCEAEKDVWASALIAARNESTIPPFELPASVSPFAPRSRRLSHTGPPPDFAPGQPPPTPHKRHTLAGGTLPTVFSPVPESTHVLLQHAQASTPLGSPTTDFGLESPSKKTSTAFAISGTAGGSTILLRRATPNQRLTVDRALVDIFSEQCAQARSKAQLHHALFLPDSVRQQDMRDRLSMRDSTMLRRRRSFLDSRSRTSSVDIAFSGDVKGSVIPIRPTRSTAGSNRNSLVSNGQANGNVRPRRASLTGSIAPAEESATEMDNADDTATSDFGTLRGGYTRAHTSDGMRTRGTSVISASPGISPVHVKTLSSFRPALDSISSGIKVPTKFTVGPPSPSPVTPLSYMSASGSGLISSERPGPPTRFASLRKSVRKSASVMNLYQRPAVPDRSKSTPASPVLKPVDRQPVPGVKRSSSDPERLPPVPPVPAKYALDRPGTGDVDGDVPPLPPPKDMPTFVPLRQDPGEDPVTPAELEMRGGGNPYETPRHSTETSGTDLPPLDTLIGGVYALGNGLTNSPGPNSNSASTSTGSRPWGSLRRTLTSRSQRNSVVNLDELLSQVSVPSTGSPASGNTNLYSPTTSTITIGSGHQRSSSSIYSRPNSSAFDQDRAGYEDSEAGGGPGEEEGASGNGGGQGQGQGQGLQITPRRRRSVRMLQSALRGFTAL